MNKLIKSLLVAAMLGGVIPAQAADTSATVTLRTTAKPVGATPTVGYVHITANSNSTANGFTFDLPVPKGKKSSDIVGFVGQMTTVSGSLKSPNIVRVGATVTVTGSNATSGTIASGDVLRGIVVYQP
ncbi:hypothetical protein [Mesorhizobium sp. B2-3-4]|uniref:hypothetical protein n=1 Tax=Mesorhizobium sp. B2-3-4 TaxID=2589959 RepID=UPI001129180C|nr:hypothetical protein [Mesorhizobium sp. B2-3-4]TPM41417.1 hypothetical protein FJ967_00320 [Mesorhizobium sp. B2-3-4]